jgi:hypothetical protein
MIQIIVEAGSLAFEWNSHHANLPQLTTYLLNPEVTG